MNKRKKYLEEENVVLQDQKEIPRGMISVKPLKDWHIVQNKYDIKLVEGETISIPEIFTQALKTEKVI